ncbi:MAG: dynamin family protein [Pseudomonadales bacterium]|nr:dynamin family protein [Pseudomonadales bacterium]
MQDTRIDRLLALTEALEGDVPAVAGAFPDLGAEARHTGDAARRAVYVLGTIKAGKSTLVNALLGRDVMPRGAGVRTFNLVHVRRAPVETARVRFRSGAELAAQLAFDFRMLGFAVELPPDPYAPDALVQLERVLQAFELVCRKDERLQEVEAEGGAGGLLALSLARLRYTIAGLRALARDFPDAVRERIAADASLAWEGEAFGEHDRWTASPELAALIHDIELGLPYPATTPPELSFVDCQGSDSLNPLDFADVQSIVQRADVILYVIQSRLGLRQADHELLRHLARVKATDRLLAVVNVEAFEPLVPEELEAQLARVDRDLRQGVGHDVPLLAVNALRILDRAVGGGDGALMDALWARRGAAESLRRLDAASPALLERLAGSGDGTDRADARLEGLVRQAADAARALLDRDRRVLGTESSGVDREEAQLAVRRVVDGEREKLRRDAAAATDAAFDRDGPIQQELDAFLDGGADRWVRERPLPATLEEGERPGAVVDAALEAFNGAWLRERAAVRRATLERLQAEFAARLDAGVGRVHRLLPQVLPEAVLGATAGDGEADGSGRARVGDAMTRRDAPHLLAPVVLPATQRRAMLAEYHSRRLLGTLARRGTNDGDGPGAERNALLWKRAARAAFRQAREDGRHALVNVRENYKFQYFYRLVDDVLEGLATELRAAVDRHYDALDRLEAGRRLLLDAPQRARVERYLDAIEALLPASTTE